VILRESFSERTHVNIHVGDESLQFVPSDALKKHKYLSIGLAILLISLLTTVLVLPSFRESPIISHEGLRSYFEEYLSEYSRLVEENMPLLDQGIIEGYSESGSHNLTFHWQRPYQVEGVISRTHGAMLSFNHSDKTAFTISDFSLPIEYYVWPAMLQDPSGLPSIRIMKASTYYHMDSYVNADGVLIYVDPGANLMYAGPEHAYRFSKGGLLIVFGSLTEKSGLILKGSNLREDWSRLQADFDSLSRFLWDCREILNETAINGIDAKYRLPLQLERISARLKSRAYANNPNLFMEDYEELKTVCMSEATLSGVLGDYYEMQGTASPTMVEQILGILNVPIVSATVAGAVAAVSGVIVGKYWERRSSRTARAANP